MSATKAILSDIDELTEQRQQLEGDFSGVMTGWLEDQSARIAGQVAAERAAPKAEFWQNEVITLTAFLLPFVIEWGEAGISHSVEIISEVGLGVDATANADIEVWASDHAEGLAENLVSTTRQLAESRIGVWLAGAALFINDLIDAIKEAIAPPWRGQLIAQTEITRGFGQAAEIVAEQTEGVKRRVWYTRRDERVCPVCAPLHGKRENARGVFNPGGFSGPPAHPRCRCGTSFEV